MWTSGSGRRELSVALLVDVSASTDSWVSGRKRIVDVEKDALFVVCEALGALEIRMRFSRSRGRVPHTYRLPPSSSSATAPTRRCSAESRGSRPTGTLVSARRFAIRPPHLSGSRQRDGFYCCCPTANRTTLTTTRDGIAWRTRGRPSRKFALRM